MTTYAELNHESRLHNERNDCTVIALAVTTEVPYRQVHTALKKRGRKDRCGSYRRQWLGAVRDLGFVYKELDLRGYAGRTVRSIETELRCYHLGQKILVKVRGHLMGFDGERFQDHARGSLRRVRQMWVVTPGNVPAPTIPATPTVITVPRKVRRPRTGAVKRVWQILDDNMFKGFSRKELIQICVDQGINKNTAATQYSHWKRATFIDLDDFDTVAPSADFEHEPVNPDPDAMAISGGTGINEATTAKYEETCEACRGSGVFYSYAGRLVGKCFKCKGAGVRRFRTSPETRAAQREANQRRKARKAEREAAKLTKWIEQHADVVAYLRERTQRWDFAASLLTSLEKYDSLTEKQMAAVERAMARDAARDAQRKAEAEKQGSDLDLSTLPSGMYAVPGGDTRLKLRISRPRKGSNWEGYIFIDDGAAYGQRRNYGRQAPGARYSGKVIDQLRAIMADPKAAMAAYGHLTGQCGVCGRKLEDEQSIERGMGPICAGKFGA